MSEHPRSRWAEIRGEATGPAYAAGLAEAYADGRDPHGEATFVARRLPVGARVLDAGCGTGRVAARLHELGIACVGVDADDSMLAIARASYPGVRWVPADLARLPAGLGSFDAVVLAGNVVPLLAEGTLAAVIADLAGVLRHGGQLIAGFGLDVEHLPDGCPVTGLAAYDEACAGLTLTERYADWAEGTADGVPGYAVTVHRRVQVA